MIIALDEATSALDTTTEKDIQRALQELIRGRSSVSIAHRLSTISASDVILVIKDGQIAEAGSHRELLARDGMFAAMWAEQISAEDESYHPHLDKKASVEIETQPVVAEGYIIDVDDAPAGDIVQEDNMVSATSPDPDIQYEMEPNPFSDPITTAIVADEPEPIVVVPSGDDEAPVASGYTAPAIPAEIEPAEPPKDEAPKAEPRAPTEEGPAPIAFPKTPDEPTPLPPAEEPKPATYETEETKPVAEETKPAGITFGTDAAETPTPDDGTKGRRMRIASQNFQKLARRITLQARKSASGSGGDKATTSDDKPVITDEPQSILTPPADAESPQPLSGDDSAAATPGSNGAAAAAAGVTFGNGVDDTPARSGTPDPDETKAKRKRISSQNFQRLAKRVSMNVQRRGSYGTVGSNGSGDTPDKRSPAKEGSSFFARIAKSDGGTPRASREEPSTSSYTEGAASGDNESVTGSVQGEGKKRKVFRF
jgi:ATP-binding cassette subfamily B (MDR/TAP) protein 6